MARGRHGESRIVPRKAGVGHRVRHAAIPERFGCSKKYNELEPKAFADLQSSVASASIRVCCLGKSLHQKGTQITADRADSTRIKPLLMLPTTKTRRWFWYTVGVVLFGVLAAGIGLVVSYRYFTARQQAQQRAAVVKVQALGGSADPSISSASPIAVLLESGNAPNIITLSELKIADDDLALFEASPTTRGLYLFNNRITDQGLGHLRNLQSLETLDLRRNPGITDAGLTHLEGLQNLRNLYLIGTGVTPAGAQKLQAKLPNTKIGY